MGELHGSRMDTYLLGLFPVTQAFGRGGPGAGRHHRRRGRGRGHHRVTHHGHHGVHGRGHLDPLARRDVWRHIGQAPRQG